MNSKFKILKNSLFLKSGFVFLLLLFIIVFSCKKDPVIEDVPFPVEGSDTNVYIVGGETYDYKATIDLAFDVSINSAKVRGRFTELDNDYIITQHGHIWSASEDAPTVINTNTRTMLGEKTNNEPFISDLTNLSPGILYYFRLYFYIDDGNEFYHPVVSLFKTLSNDTQAPDILTVDNVDSLRNISAYVSGYLLNHGSSDMTAHGFCWSQTNQQPTVNDSYNNLGTYDYTGKFISEITGLTPETVYYYRAYASNSYGTNYGNVYSFTTKSNVPEGFIQVSGGTFTQGSQGGNEDEKPEHSVTLSPFFISEHEVTNSEFAQFLTSYGSYIVQSGEYQGQHLIDYNDITQLNESNGTWSVVAGYENYPMIYVSWYGAYTFCQYYQYRLPTESEWEYASKGGSLNSGYTYSGSSNCDNVAWYSGNSTTSNPVKQKTENELGIYDMSGNVWEWCNDWYYSGYYEISPNLNPSGPANGEHKVIRGGSWDNDINSCRNTNRGKLEPYQRNNFTGFRCVIDIE